MKIKNILAVYLVVLFTLSSTLLAEEYTNTSFYVAYDIADKTQYALVLPSVNKVYTHKAGKILPEDLKQINTQFKTSPTYNNGELCFSTLIEGTSGEDGASVMADQCYSVNFFYTQKEAVPDEGMAFILTYTLTDKVYEGLAGDADSFKVVKEGDDIHNENSITGDDYTFFRFDVADAKALVLTEAPIIDPIFGTNGKVKEVISSYGGAYVNSILVQEDDKIITVGTDKDTDGYRIITLYRYLPDGARDPSFGNNGAVTADHICTDWDACGGTRGMYYRGQESVRDALLQPDGKIVVQTDDRGTVARFNTDGSLDTMFGAHGGFGYGAGTQYANSHAMTLQNDGKILVVGEYNSIELSRYTADGFLDTLFNNGMITTSVSDNGNYDNGNDVTVQANGKTIVVGSYTDTLNKYPGCEEQSTHPRGVILRYNQDGTLDNSFNNNGILKFNVGSIYDSSPTWGTYTSPCVASKLHRVTIQPDGKMLVLGTGHNSPFSFFLARFNTDGNLDVSFGYEGAIAMYTAYDYDTYEHEDTVFTYHGMMYQATNMQLLKNGKIVVVGNSYGGSYNGSNDRFLAVQFNSNGSFDHTFGSYGRKIINPDPDDYLYGGTNALSVAEQSSGKLLLGGYVNGTLTPYYSLLMRLY